MTDPNKEKLEDLARLGWYHSMELPDGRVIPGFQSLDASRRRLAQFPVPSDLRGKRALDIGAWDGWFSFELERRGARVTAVDATAIERFRIARELLGSQVEYRIADVCRLSPAEIGYFDLVMFLGVLYHLKHPMLALETVCALATDMVCVESFVIDDPADPAAKPLMEFYETTQLCGQFDNWVGPNTACLLAMCRSAGFARVHLESVLDHRAHVTCYRRWPEIQNPREPAPYPVSVENAVTRDREFSAANDDYVAIWFESPQPDLTAADVFPRIGPYGSHPVFLENTGGDFWHVNCKLPPGLAPGWHAATLRTMDSPWGNPVRIGVDLTPERRRTRAARPRASNIRIAIVTDGKTWERSLIHTGIQSCISLWVAGLPEDAARDAIGVSLDGEDLPALFLSKPDAQGLRQINAMLPSGARPGAYAVAVTFQEGVSEGVPITLA
ncbi:MAG TPA: methyltransferase domain-containing protein [Bryobacteraceae bacterium]|nr:methyltransferase domain-containing protein [Bryobacteraceae bacterium]